MKISCLMLTYARYRHEQWNAISLVEEALECFLRQTYADKELIIVNDAPGQTLLFNHPQVKVINLPERFKCLGAKRNYAIAQATGEVLTTWDDDDIRLPSTLDTIAGVANKFAGSEWYAAAKHYWYSENNQIASLVETGARGHFASASYSRALADKVKYQEISCGEDQAFCLDAENYGAKMETICVALPAVDYIYRWGYMADHLSGRGYDPHAGYEAMGKITIPEFTYTLKPHWVRDYVADALLKATTHG